MLPDLMTVSRAIEEGPQYKHVQGPLEKSDPLLCLFCHRRHSTLNLVMMVDTRLSIVKWRCRMWILRSRLQPEARFQYCYFALVSWPHLVEVRFHPGTQEHPLV
jgi:hypothetical protein